MASHDITVDHTLFANVSFVDLRVAREQGIEVPQELLFRADEVIRW